MQRLLVSALALTACVLPVAAQPTLLRDISTTTVPGDSSPDDLVTAGSTSGPSVWFSAATTAAGRELFRSDGTPFGTGMVEDLVPGTAGSSPRALAPVNNGVVFIGIDPSTGSDAVWFSDGTSGGTSVLAGLATTGEPYDAVAVGGRYVARMKGTLSAPTVVVSDGSAGGTTEVQFPPAGQGTFLTGADPIVVRGTSGSGIEVGLTVVGTASGFDVVRSDGTPAGTVVVASVPTSAPTVSILALAQTAPGRLSVVTTDLPGPSDAHVIDIDGPGTVVSGPFPTALPPAPALATEAFDGRLLSFLSSSVVATDDMAQSVALNLPAGAMSPRSLGGAGGSLFLAAENGGTRLLRLDPGSNTPVDTGPLPGTSPATIATSGTTLFVAVSMTADEDALLAIDTATSGVTTLTPSPFGSIPRVPGAALGSSVLFAADDSTSGNEPWTTDGSVSGTTRLADLAPPVPAGPGSLPHAFTGYGGRAAFVAESDSGPRVFVTDGTANGTIDVAPARETTRLIRAADHLWSVRPFNQLSVTDVAGGSTLDIPSAPVSIPQVYAAFGDGVLAGRGSTLVRVGNDGSIQLLASSFSPNPGFAVVFGEEALVTNSALIVRTDGTPPGTQSFVTGPFNFPSSSAAFDGRYWVSLDSVYSTEGSAVTQETVPLLPATLVSTGDRLFTLTAAYGLVTDGTVPGTGSFPTAGLGGPEQTEGFAFGDDVLFTSRVFSPPPTSPDRLWFTDGTPPVLLHPGPVRDVTVVSRNQAYFLVGGPSGELWQTDGTVAGTTPVLPGSDVLELGYADGRLFLAIDDPSVGIEPFTLVPDVVNAPIGVSCSGHPTGTHTLGTDIDPRVGATVTVRGRSRFDRAGVGNDAFLFLGSAIDPQPLSPTSKCEFLVDLGAPLILFQQPIAPDGSFQQVIDIPPFPILAGLQFTLQAVILPSPGPAGLDVTNGLTWVIGS